MKCPINPRSDYGDVFDLYLHIIETHSIGEVTAFTLKHLHQCMEKTQKRARDGKFLARSRK